MRNLGFRFVDRTVEGAAFVVDPYLDLRHRFTDALNQSVKARRLNVDLKAVQRDYMTWWDRFLTYQQDPSRENKSRIRADWPKIEAALKLPNILTDIQPLCNNIKPNPPSSTLQSWSKCQLADLISNQLSELIPDVIRLSPPHLVRSAVVEGCQLSVESFPSVRGSDTRLVGISLPSMISTFVEKEISARNQWPLTFVSQGRSYTKMARSIKEVDSVCLLSLSESDNVNHFAGLVTPICTLLQSLPNLSMNIVEPHLLTSIESAALELVSVGTKVARLSVMGSLPSKLLHVTVSSDSVPSEVPLFPNVYFCALNCTDIFKVVRAE